MSHILLSIKNIKKNYYHRSILIKEALKGITLDLYRGEVLSLLGINGAGKTTLSSIIATLHPPTLGDIEFNGLSIYKNLNDYRHHIGFCPQAPNLNPDLTLKQNLFFAGKFYHMEDHEVQDKINQLVKEFELEEYLEQKAEVLSGGYRQRFMIARTLIHNPRLVILDEPTVGLDPHVRHQLWEKISTLKRNGITVLLTTHYLDEAETLSDRVCILHRGEVKLLGSPQQLMTTFQKSRLEDVFLQLIHEETKQTQEQ